MSLTPEGLLLQRALDLDFFLQQPGAGVTVDDVGYAEMIALKVLDEARSLREKEKADEANAKR